MTPNAGAGPRTPLALDHLPLRLDVADGLEQVGAARRTRRRRRELAVEPCDQRAGVGLGRVEDVGLLAHNLVVDDVIINLLVTAGGEQREGRNHADGEAKGGGALHGHQPSLDAANKTGGCDAANAVP